jgi:hypothetical protein
VGLGAEEAGVFGAGPGLGFADVAGLVGEVGRGNESDLDFVYPPINDFSLNLALFCERSLSRELVGLPSILCTL